MKSTKPFMFIKLTAIAVLLLSLVAVSCKEDDDDKNTDYVGTWARTETLDFGEFQIQVQDLMIFTENKVTNIGQAWDSENEEWIVLLSMKADIDVKGDEIDVTVTEIGFTDFDEDGIPTGEMIYFSEGDLGFDEALAELELEQSFTAQYNVTNNELDLKMDTNDDGDYSDEDETAVYFKE